MTDNWEESLEPIYSNDTELTKDICDFLKCSEYKHGNESEPTACYGCDAMYDIFYQEEKRIIEDDDKYNYIQSLLDKKKQDAKEMIKQAKLGVLDEFQKRIKFVEQKNEFDRGFNVNSMGLSLAIFDFKSEIEKE